MVYQRATEGTHQVWANKVGDDAYRWDKFLPWYKKSVNFTEPDMNLRMANSTPSYTAFDAADANGSGLGHLSVTWSHYAQAFGTWATRAFELRHQSGNHDTRILRDSFLTIHTWQPGVHSAPANHGKTDFVQCEQEGDGRTRRD